VSSMFEGSDSPDSEALVRRVIEIIGNAKPLPLSTTVRVEKEEVLELLDDALDRFPQELRQARYMLKERDEYLAKVQREADEILEAARVRAERMVQRQDIVREATHTAERIVEKARDEAARLRMEAEDYCDQKLAGFEIVLERTAKTVAAGREKLRATPAPASGDQTLGFGGGAGPAHDLDDGFFDQDG
jgi:F0F1-type ATP synthase membrane subunit b/b'